MSFGVRLKELRKEHGMTLEEAAGKLGVSIPALSGWEQGHRRPNIEMMKQLTALYGTSADYILGLTEDREPKPLTMNAKEILMKKGLHWDGQPLSDEELRTMRVLLEYVLNEKKKEDANADDRKAQGE